MGQVGESCWGGGGEDGWGVEGWCLSLCRLCEHVEWNMNCYELASALLGFWVSGFWGEISCASSLRVEPHILAGAPPPARWWEARVHSMQG